MPLDASGFNLGGPWLHQFNPEDSLAPSPKQPQRACAKAPVSASALPDFLRQHILRLGEQAP